MNKLILVLSLSACLVACGKQVTTPVVPVSAPKVRDPGPFLPSTDESLDALVRAFPHSSSVCFDPPWGFYVQYTPFVIGKTDELYHGIFLLKDIEFGRSDNGTYFIMTVPALSENTWPDLKGLQCKQTPPAP